MHTMEHRHEKLNLTPATVVDLDGTYLSCNTMKVYALTGIRFCLRRWHILDALRVAGLIAIRRLRLISHRRMKFSMLGILSRHDEIMAPFQKKIRSMINPAVRGIIDRNIEAGHRILLATAAPDIYVPLIWSGDFVATKTTDNHGMIECRGIEKLNRVKAWIEKNGCRLDSVITDHYDDAPLMEFNCQGCNIIINPDSATLRFLGKFKPSHFLIIKDGDDFVVSQ